jgi:hypothetical protein
MQRSPDMYIDRPVNDANKLNQSERQRHIIFRTQIPTVW